MASAIARRTPLHSLTAHDWSATISWLNSGGVFRLFILPATKGPGLKSTQAGSGTNSSSSVATAAVTPVDSLTTVCPAAGIAAALVTVIVVAAAVAAARSAPQSHWGTLEAGPLENAPELILGVASP